MVEDFGKRDEDEGLEPKLLSALCRAYAQLLRRQRTASSVFVNWPSATRRAHEFAWIGASGEQETLMMQGNGLRIGRDSPIYESVQKMYATAELNPYEREILYGYPYIVGRLGERPVRAPLLTLAVRIVTDRDRFMIEPDDEVIRLNTLPFSSETNSAARERALDRLIESTPVLPLSVTSLNAFVGELKREIPEVQIPSAIVGKLSAAPSMPNSGSYLELIEHAAIFVAPKTSYFLTSDLEAIAADEVAPQQGPLTALITGAGMEAQAEFEVGAEDSEAIVYPFPSNRSQRRVAMLVDHPDTRVVRIEGPPGTGKSLTIANLVCHLAATGRTVLVTSQKDKALDVVDEKLRELGLPQIPMTLLRRDPASKKDLRERLDSIEKTNAVSEAEQKERARRNRFESDKAKYGQLKKEFATAFEAESQYIRAERTAGLASGIRRIAASWRFRHQKRHLRRVAPRGTGEVAERASATRRSLLEGAVALLQASLEHRTSAAQRSERQQIRQFSALLKRDQSTYRNFSIFDRLKEVPERTAMLLKLLPAWIMTPDDVARLFPCQPGLFDVVIVDEASQVDLPSIWPILYRGKKAVVCGDTYQMQAQRFAFTQQRLAIDAWLHHGMNVHDPESFLQPTKQSLLDLAYVRAEEEVFLDEHFRCLPPIINFSNKRWYNNRLRVMTDETRKRFGEPGQTIAQLHRVPEGKVAPGTQENPAEAQALLAELRRMVKHPNYADASIGVICLFEEQVRLVQDLISEQIDPAEWEAHAIVVVNPDGFQGDERDVVLYSLSFDNDVMPRAALSARQANQEHVQGMLNVGFTRARDEIHIFHSAPIEAFTLADGTSGAIAEWLQHCARVQEEPPGKQRRSRLGRSDSEFESEVSRALEEGGYEVMQQYPSCGFFIDIVAEREGIQLAIECDGELWHQDEHGELKMEDLERQAVLERAGWDVLRVPYREWVENPTAQLARIDDWFDPQIYGYGDPPDPPNDPPATRQPHFVTSEQAAVLKALQGGLRDGEQVIKEARGILGYEKTGKRIRRGLEAAAGSLERSGLIVVEDGEYFLTAKGRDVEPAVWSPPSRSYGTPKYSRRPQYSQRSRREFHPIVCSSCGASADVPFKPRSGRPVYCRSCYYKRMAR